MVPSWRSVGIGSMVFLALAVGTASAEQFTMTNLVTDNQAVNMAVLTDPNLKNAWGLSFSGAGPFWVSANGSGLATLYRVDATTNIPSKLALEVTIPGAGSVAGQGFNGTGGSNFNGDSFLFVSEDGTVSGWRGALGTTAEVLQSAQPQNVYKGAAIGQVGTDGYLYAANFHQGTIDVLKGTPGSPNLVGSFTDPSLPAGFAPFNIQNLGGILYVTYAKQDSTGEDDEPGPGNGFVDAFDLQGNLLGRIGTKGTLNSPWGLALAPASFGEFAGDLLVGNFGDGTINAFNLVTNSFVGQLAGEDGKPLVIDGLWGLLAGNGGDGGDPKRLYFSAGPNAEQDGLFGSLSPAVPEPTGLSLLALGTLGVVVYTRRCWKRRAE
jgi:uncharacterized protein (TIGR03118 family)